MFINKKVLSLPSVKWVQSWRDFLTEVPRKEHGDFQVDQALQSFLHWDEFLSLPDLLMRYKSTIFIVGSSVWDLIDGRDFTIQDDLDLRVTNSLVYQHLLDKFLELSQKGTSKTAVAVNKNGKSFTVIFTDRVTHKQKELDISNGENQEPNNSCCSLSDSLMVCFDTPNKIYSCLSLELIPWGKSVEEFNQRFIPNKYAKQKHVVFSKYIVWAVKHDKSEDSFIPRAQLGEAFGVGNELHRLPHRRWTDIFKKHLKSIRDVSVFLKKFKAITRRTTLEPGFTPLINDALKYAAEEQEKSKAQVGALQVKLDEEQQKSNALQAKIAAIQAQVKRFEKDVLQQRQLVSKHTASLKSARAELATSKSNESALQAELATSKSNEAALRAELATSKSNEAALEEDLELEKENSKALQGNFEERQERACTFQTEIELKQSGNRIGTREPVHSLSKYANLKLLHLMLPIIALSIFKDDFLMEVTELDRESLVYVKKGMFIVSALAIYGLGMSEERDKMAREIRELEQSPSKTLKEADSKLAYYKAQSNNHLFTLHLLMSMALVLGVLIHNDVPKSQILFCGLMFTSLLHQYVSSPRFSLKPND